MKRTLFVLAAIMMAYVNQSDLKGKISERDLISALDDNGDGAVDTDVWAQIQVDVQTYIDGTLGQRFSVPFVDPIPPVIKLAATTFALEQIYSRRTMADDKAPFVLQANAQRSKLAAIAAGTQPLTPDSHRAKATGVVITDSAKTQPRSGRSNI